MPRRHPFDQTSIDAMIAKALAEHPPADTGDPGELAPTSIDEAPEPSGPSNFRKFGLPALGAGTALDLISSHAALGRPGTQEGNPLMNGMGRGKMVATNAAITAAMALLLDHAVKKNPTLDKLATTLGIGVGGVRGAVGVRNFGQGR